MRYFGPNEYMLAKIAFDTAENGPLKVCQKLAKVRKELRTNIDILRVMNPKLAQVTLSKNWMDIEHANFLQIAAVGAVLSRSVSAQQKLRYAFSLFDFNCSESLGENEFSMAFRCIFSGLSLAFEKVHLVERFDIEPFPDFSAK